MLQVNGELQGYNQEGAGIIRPYNHKMVLQHLQRRFIDCTGLSSYISKSGRFLRRASEGIRRDWKRRQADAVEAKVHTTYQLLGRFGLPAAWASAAKCGCSV